MLYKHQWWTWYGGRWTAWGSWGNWRHSAWEAAERSTAPDPVGEAHLMLSTDDDMGNTPATNDQNDLDLVDFEARIKRMRLE